MREILFRGKPKNKEHSYFFSEIWKDHYEKGFVYGSLIVYKDRYFITVSARCDIKHCVNNGLVSMIEVDPETVGQDTGLTDKNGKKIFEGDIIKADNGKQSSISVVKFGEYYPKLFFAMLDICCTGVQHLNANGFYLESAKHEDMILFKSRHLVVIGNIHDNPKLIKEEGGT